MLKTFLIIILIIIVIVAFIVIIDSNRFVVTEYEIKSSKLDKDHDFMFVADLHSKSYGHNNKRLFSAIDKLNVEGALFAGDIMTAKGRADNTNAVFFVNEIAKRMPVYYGIGNHELRAANTKYYGNILSYYIDNIKESGVSFLDNEKVVKDDICISGLSIEEPYYIRFVKMNMAEDYLETKLGPIDNTKFNIVLAHDPEYAESYVHYNADLILSGHYHGGIARIPGIGGVISPRLILFPKYSGGIYHILNSTLIVSKGLGMHSIPVRFLNPAELIVIHLKKD